MLSSNSALVLSLAAVFLLPLAAFGNDTSPQTVQKQGAETRQELQKITNDARNRVRISQEHLEQRLVEIHRINTDASNDASKAEIHNRYEEFTRLCNQLQDDVDSYVRQHADIRKQLKVIGQRGQKWRDGLNEPRPNTEYEFARQNALAAAESLLADTKNLLDQETEHFHAKKRPQ
jgi:hypothetical protein